MRDPQKAQDLQRLRETVLDVRSDEGMIKDLLQFACKELIEIKYVLKDIRDLNQ